LRIAFVSDNAFPWFNGGLEKRRFIIMRKMAEEGHEVHCFTTQQESMPGAEFKYEGIRYHCLGEASGWQGMYTSSGKRRSMKMPIMFSYRLFIKILAYRFDVLDTDEFPFLHIIPLLVYSRIRRTKFVVTWHEVWDRKFWKRYLGVFGSLGYFAQWVCAHSSDMLIANASTTKKLLEKELGVDGSKIVEFTVAIDKKEIEEFTSKHACKKKDEFVVVNRLVKHKRVQLAIEAVSETDAKLTVVGTGPELEYLENFAKEKAPGRVVFKHAVSTELLFEQMCRAKALIMPSEREGLSLVTLEALAVGTPVVIADTSMLPKEVRRMCLEAKESEMGDLLNRMLKDYSGYQERSKRIVGEVIDEFSGDSADSVYRSIGRR
jgi:glycosyltransferase involved in cell wall biosynthesis